MLSWWLVFLLSISLVGAKELKVGYVDSGRILQEYMGVGELLTQFEKEMETWEEEATKLQREIDDLVSELKSQELMLSDEAKSRKRTEIDEKEKSYRSFVQEIWGPEGRAVKRRDQLTQPVVETIDEILERIGSEEGYTVIFDISGGSVVYAEEGLDLTDRVLEELNKEFLPTVRKEKAKFVVFQFVEKTREATESKLGEKIPRLLKAALPLAAELEKVDEGKVTVELRRELIDKPEDIDFEVASRIGEKVEAEFVFRGRVSKLGGKIEVEVDLIEVADRRKITTELGSSGEKDEEIEVMVGKLASDLALKLKL